MLINFGKKLVMQFFGIVYFLDNQGQLSQIVGSSQNSNSFKLSCMSLLP